MKREDLKPIQQIIIGENHFREFSIELQKLAEKIISLRYVHETTGEMSDIYFDKYCHHFIGLLSDLEDMKARLVSIKSEWDLLERDLIYRLAQKYKPTEKEVPNE